MRTGHSNIYIQSEKVPAARSKIRRCACCEQQQPLNTAGVSLRGRDDVGACNFSGESEFWSDVLFTSDSCIIRFFLYLISYCYVIQYSYVIQFDPVVNNL